MITNQRDKRICEKYSAKDETGHVRCAECPLNKGNPIFWDFRCKANSHYDHSERDWVYDDIKEVEI